MTSPRRSTSKPPSVRRDGGPGQHEAARRSKQSGESSKKDLKNRDRLRLFAHTLPSLAATVSWLAPVNTLRWARGNRVKVASAASTASATLTRSSTPIRSVAERAVRRPNGQTFELGLRRSMTADRMIVGTGVLGRGGRRRGHPSKAPSAPSCSITACSVSLGLVPVPPTAGLREVLTVLMVVALSAQPCAY